MPNTENPYEPSTTDARQTQPAQPPPLGAEQAVRNACRYAIPVMSIGWVLLWVEFYFSYAHRINKTAAVTLGCLQSLAYAGLGLGIWLGCAAIVGAIRR